MAPVSWFAIDMPHPTLRHSRDATAALPTRAAEKELEAIDVRSKRQPASQIHLAYAAENREAPCRRSFQTRQATPDALR